MRMYFVDGVVFVYSGGQQKLQEGVALCGGRVSERTVGESELEDV